MRPRFPLLLAALAVLSLVPAALLFGTTAAGAQGPTLTGQLLSYEPPGPVYPSFAADTCVSAGSCVAVGSFSNDVNDAIPLVDTEVAGSWGDTTSAAGSLLPSGAVSGALDAVSCVSTTSCVAVGYDGDAAGNVHLLVAELSGSTWTATTLADPASPAASSQPVFTGVSCTAAGTCTAVGYTTTTAEVPLVATLSAGSWSATELSLPSGAPYAFLNAVSCVSATACVAGGAAQTASDAGIEPLVETGAGSTWSATTMTPVTGTTASQIWGIACNGSTTTCSAALTGLTTAGRGQAEVAQDTGSGWPTSPTAPAVPASTVGSGLYAISCPTATSCVAAGFYNTGKVAQLTEVLSGGTFSPVTTGLTERSTFAGISCPTVATTCAAVDSTADIYAESTGTWRLQVNLNEAQPGPPEPELDDVVCLSATACVAVGDSSGTDDDSAELVATMSGSSWTVSQPAALDAAVPLLGLSCQSAAACTAVGGNEAATLTSGTWTQTAVPEPASPTGETGLSLQTVSCWDVGSCVAGGYLYDSSGDQLAVASVLSGGTWTSANVPDPTGDDGDAEINGIDCGGSGNCVAVGDYYDSSGLDHPFIETLVSGTWTEVSAPVPTAATEGGQLFSVTCSSGIADCTAVGSWFDANGESHPLIDTLSGGSWSTLATDLAPSTSSGASLYGVSCQIATACTAVGAWFDSANDLSHSFSANLVGGSWATDTAIDPSSAEEGQLNAVSCLDTVAGDECQGVGQAGPVNDLAIEVAAGTTSEPVVTTTSPPAATDGTSYSTQLAASGGTHPYTWALASGSLPAGLSLDPDGIISGVPSATGSSSFTVTVTDAEGLSATSSSLTITVNAAPAITTTSLPGGTVDAAYDATVTSTGGTAPYVWAVLSGSLPPGLSLSPSTGPSAAVSGTPTATGAYTFTVDESDANGATATATLTLTIAALPSVTTTSLPGATQGIPYSTQLAASGGTAPYSWSVTAGSLPAGLSLGSATGAITGTPTASGASTVTVTVTDANRTTGSSGSLTLTVNPPPVLTTSSLPGGQVGDAYSAGLAASGGTGPYTWAVSSGALPAGLSLTSSGGATAALSGTPTTAGASTFTVTETDANGATAAAQFTVTIAAAPSPPPPTGHGGYDLVGSDGGVFVFPTGQAGGYYGSLPGLNPPVVVHDIVGIVPSSDDKGYFLVGSDGGVFSFGDTTYEGSLPGLHVAVDDIVGIVPTTDDKGYFLVGRDGGVFSFGDSTYEGSLPGDGISVDDVTGIAATSDDRGYWVVASNGTVYAFGDAASLGNATGTGSNAVGIASTPDGKGYWVVDQNGDVVAQGDAGNFGDLPTLHVTPARPVVAIVPTNDANGYWLIGSDGGVFSFGDATSEGSLPGLGVAVDDVVGAVPTA